MIQNDKPVIAIAGATGAVGRELLKLIDQRGLQYSRLELIASKRSAGKLVSYRGEDYEVKDLETFDFTGVDIAFFSAGTSISKIHAGRAAAQGALVIDNTNAYRMDPLSPLVVPQVNAHELASRPRSGIIANPNCSTIQMVRALKPIHDEYLLKRVVVSTYQAASGAGLTGMDELRGDSARSLKQPSAAWDATRFPRPLAFNVIPQVDVFQDDGYTLEERKMLQETRKILALPKLDVTATAVRVPVLNGHSESVYLETEKPLDRSRVLELLREAEEVKVYDGAEYPTPRFVEERDHVHVGRVRLHPENPRGLWLWVVADNLWIGAALNAIQIAEKVVARTAVPA